MGYAQLVDQAGMVWLGHLSDSTGVFNLWRDGKIVQTMSVPGFDYNKGALFSTAPGSVFAVTNGGLQHLVADAPDYAQYRIGKLYSLSKVAGEYKQVLVTSHSELVIATKASGTSGSTSSVWLIKLPETGGK